MSLQIVAQHLAAKGRGPDTTLVHMTPGEVNSMQALAKAHGGSLTVNPDTGLPEAGVLSSLLPTLIGAGITAATGGAAAPWMIGAGVGGLQALRTGNLGKGLMAGLGAYGGAGLTGSLAGMGEAALAQQAGAQGPTLGSGIMAADKAGGVTAAQNAAQSASFGDKLAAGMKTWDWNKPMDFVSGLGGGSKGKGIGMIAGAFAPSVMAALEPNQYAPQQLVSDSRRAPGLVYRGGNVYDRMTPEQEAARSMKYGFAEGGLATGGVPEWNPEWNPDVPEYGDLGRDFGRERLYATPVSSLPSLEKLAAKQVETTVAQGEGGQGGQDFGGMGSSTPDWGTALSIGQTLSGLGLSSLGDSISAQARMGINAQTGAYSDAAQSQRAAEAYGGGSTDSAGGYGGVGGQTGGDGAVGFGGTYADGGITGSGGLNLQIPLSIGNGGIGSLSGSGAQGTGGIGGVNPYAPMPKAQPEPAQPMSFGPRPTPAIVPASQTDSASEGFRKYHTMGPESLGLNPETGHYSWEQGSRFFAGGGLTAFASGGLGSLGSYSDGGRLLRGPGDGVSDHIPATIGRGRQPARLADGEFVVPARIVSELGNGSTEAGARALYAMMDRIQKNRRKTVGKGKVAVNSKSTRLLPA